MNSRSLSKRAILCFITQNLVFKRPKEKCLQNTKGQESKDIFWIIEVLYGPVPKEVSQKLMDCTRSLSHFCLEDHLQAAVIVARDKTFKYHKLVCAFENNSRNNHLIRNAGLNVSCHIYKIAVCRVAVYD